MTEQGRGHPKEQTSKPYFGLVHAFYAQMGGFAFYDDNNATVNVPTTDMFHYIMEYFPDIITNIREETILDRAASSSLDKFVLTVQVAWFCINCGSRLVQHLPLTLLEVSTAAHAFCTLATYFVWWSKPLNVAEPMLLWEKEAQGVYALLKCSDSDYKTALEIARKGGTRKGETRDPGASQGPQPSARVVLVANALGRILNTKRPAPEQPALEQPPNLYFRTPSTLIPGKFPDWSFRKILFPSISLAISPILYGPIHFLAWNHNFPTSMERLLWRVSSIVVTCSGFVDICVVMFRQILSFREGTVLEFLLITLSIVVIPAIHMLASGYLIVESFRELASLDSAAYQLPSWSYYWPHIS